MIKSIFPLSFLIPVDLKIDEVVWPFGVKRAPVEKRKRDAILEIKHDFNALALHCIYSKFFAPIFMFCIKFVGLDLNGPFNHYGRSGNVLIFLENNPRIAENHPVRAYLNGAVKVK